MDDDRCRTCKTKFNRPRYVAGFHRLLCSCGRHYRFDPGPLEQRDIRLEDMERREIT